VRRGALRYSERVTVHTALPSNYQEALCYPITARRRLLLLNVLALIPLAVMGAGMFALWALYEALDAPLTLAFLDQRLLLSDFDIPAMLVLLLLVLPLHELCHGLAFRLLGVRKMHYGIKPRRMILYAMPAGEAYLGRDQFILATLTPLLFVTALGVPLLLLLPFGARLLLVLVVAFNAAGAVGDLWAVGVVMRFGADALVRDLGDTFVVYIPSDSIPPAPAVG
jgi:hypothetical protein